MLANKDYLGNFSNAENQNKLIEYAVREEVLPSLFLAYNRFGVFPNILNVRCNYLECVKIEDVENLLTSDYGHDFSNDLTGHRYIGSTKTRDPWMVQVNEGILICMTGSSRKGLVEGDEEKTVVAVESFKFFYMPGKFDEAKTLAHKLLSKKITKTETTLNMVCKSQSGLYLTDMNIKKPKITDLALHYGDEFVKVNEKIVAGLEKKDGSGIVLLHGEPGTGKTHYIRYLIQSIKGKKMIYVPPDMASSIASPEFLPFMLNNTDSILIIEDAENVIKDRVESEQKTQALSNILNLSDGLLGDSLRQPIIATFNCEISKIDSALLRNGRLIANHEFKKLPVEKAAKLGKELGVKRDIVEATTLADIYALLNEE
jgi:hypothetical protein